MLNSNNEAKIILQMIKITILKYVVVLLFMIVSNTVLTQSLNLQLVNEHEYPEFRSALTPKVDVLGRPYLYVASNELGLRIYNTSTGLNHILDLDTLDLEMRVMSVNQVDTVLFVCIGSSFNSTDPFGLATVGVGDPENPIVLDVYMNGSPGGGSGIVELSGDYAFLGAMPQGLVILDISDPYAISFVSDIVPEISYPHSGNTQNLVNARGMAIKDSLVFLCYDAGGLRVINCSDINNPVEIGRYANPITFEPYNMPRAYNNIVLDDTVAYLAVDYCGIEVIGISDPENLYLIQHWNPNDCPNGVWWDAPIHANELKIRPDCDILFVSTGKSEMKVMDITDPYNIYEIDSYGSLMDTTGSWGLDITESDIYLTYVYVPTFVPFPFTPFHSIWSGVKQISYDSPCLNGMKAIKDKANIHLFPNPTSDYIGVDNPVKIGSYLILDISGQIVLSGKTEKDTIDVSSLERGMYYLLLNSENSSPVKFVKK